MRRTSKEAWGRIHAGEGFLYLAEAGRHIKIGFSLNPASRLSSTQWRLLATIPGTFKQERALHKTLRAVAVKDETYRRSVLDHPALPAGLQPKVEGLLDTECDPAMLALGIRVPKKRRPLQLSVENRKKAKIRAKKFFLSRNTVEGIRREQGRLDGMNRAGIIVFRG